MVSICRKHKIYVMIIWYDSWCDSWYDMEKNISEVQDISDDYMV